MRKFVLWALCAGFAFPAAGFERVVLGEIGTSTS